MAQIKAWDGAGVTRFGAFSSGDDVAAGRLVPILKNFSPGDVENINLVFVGGANTPVSQYVDFPTWRLEG